MKSRVRRHAPMLVLTCVALAVRVLVMLAYRPAFGFADSDAYIHAAKTLIPDAIRPWGYSGFLLIFLPLRTKAAVVAAQHLLVLALGVGSYVFLVNRRVPRWAATAAPALMLLDPVGIDVEHHLLADTLFMILVGAGVLTLIIASERRTRRPMLTVSAAALIMAAATLTRTAGVPLIPLALVFLLVTRAGWRHIAAFGVVATMPIAIYCFGFLKFHGQFEMSSYSGHFLYARVAPFADCSKLSDAPDVRRYCPREPVALRPEPEFWLWDPRSPGYPAGNDARLARFARLVIERQPATYASQVATDTAHFFAPGRPVWRWDGCVGCWDYPAAPRPGDCGYPMTGTDLDGRDVGCSGNRIAATAVRQYAYAGYATGPILGAFLIGGVVALVRRSLRNRWHAPFLCFTTALILMIFAVATSAFDYRYGLPALVLIPLGAALALTATPEGDTAEAVRDQQE